MNPRSLATRLLAVSLCVLTGCGPNGCNTARPGAGIRWTNYPALAHTTTSYDWLVVKCRLSDISDIPTGLDTDIQGFFGISGAGYGNLVDYFHDVSYNRAQVMGTKFIGWITAPFSSKDLAFPGGKFASASTRAQRVQACLSAIPSDQAVALDEFYGVVVVNNTKNDGGACGTGQITLSVNNKNYNLACVWFDPDSLSTDFAGHEFSHGLGLDHSYDDSGRVCANGGQPGEYCDPYDIMSAQITAAFSDKNWLIQKAASNGGPGMNTPNLLQMGWVPPGARKDYSIETGGNQQFKLRALSHARAEDALVAILNVGANPFDNLYTVEYRQADGWDRGLATSSRSPAAVQAAGGVVLVHQYRGPAAPSSTLINGAFAGALEPSNTLVLPGFGGLTYHVTVQSIDTKDASAIVEIGSGRGPVVPQYSPVAKQRDKGWPFSLFP